MASPSSVGVLPTLFWKFVLFVWKIVSCSTTARSAFPISFLICVKKWSKLNVPSPLSPLIYDLLFKNIEPAKSKFTVASLSLFFSRISILLSFSTHLCFMHCFPLGHFFHYYNYFLRLNLIFLNYLFHILLNNDKFYI